MHIPSAQIIKHSWRGCNTWTIMFLTSGDEMIRQLLRASNFLVYLHSKLRLKHHRNAIWQQKQQQKRWNTVLFNSGALIHPSEKTIYKTPRAEVHRWGHVVCSFTHPPFHLTFFFFSFYQVCKNLKIAAFLQATCSTSALSTNGPS